MKSSECKLGLKESSDNKTNCISDQSFFFFPAKSNGAFGSLSETVQRSVVEVLFHLPTLDGELFKEIVLTCCQGGHVSVSVMKYILQVLHYRFVKS